MRVVVDINILVSALIAPAGKPAAIIDAWLDGKIYAADLRAACRRAAHHAAKAQDRQANQAP
jgi:hypothetical protein